MCLGAGRLLCGWGEDSEVAIARQETRDEKAFTRMVTVRTSWAGTV